jgi:hypothetical protein
LRYHGREGYAEVSRFGIVDNYVHHLNDSQVADAMVSGYPCMRCHS